MKKLIGVMLVAAAGAAVFAAPAFRVDVNGARKEGKVRLEPVAGEQMKVMAPAFRPEAERVNYVTAYSAAPLKAGEWTECTFSFRVADGGRVTLEMGGQWAQNKDAREWVLVGPVKVNGEVLPNSDYAKPTKPAMAGPCRPAIGWPEFPRLCRAPVPTARRRSARTMTTVSTASSKSNRARPTRSAPW